MSKPKLIQTKRELRANVSRFTNAVRVLAKADSIEKQVVANGCSHAVEWVAFPDGKGGWEVAFSKYVGYSGITPEIYDKYRNACMTGTDTKRLVQKFGGTVYGVGRDSTLSNRHPAVETVQDVCEMLDKTPKATAVVRVFSSDERPATMDVLVAAIRAAELSDEDFDTLLSELGRAG